MASEAQIKANRENALKGGRPKGTIAKSTKIAIEVKEYIAKRVKEENGPIVDKAIEQAKEGDRSARDWLYDRFAGKATQHTDITSDGESLFNEHQKEQARKALQDFVGE